MRHIIRKTYFLLLTLFMSFVLCLDSFGQERIVTDSLYHLSKKEKKEEAKKEMNLHPRFQLNVSAVYSYLDTYVRMETPNNLISVKIGLEENLGLTNVKSFTASTFMYRITKKSGIYTSYYGLNRNSNYTVNQDIPYMDGWIPEGSEINAYFNTQVVTLGYMYSILADHNAFLGAYFNVFLMELKTGVSSYEIELDQKITLVAPLPNIGLVMYFKLYKCLGFGANIGTFFINTNDFKGKLFNFNMDMTFTATRWLGFTLGYKTFNIQAYFPEQNYNVEIGYDFRGPSVGAFFKF